MGINLIRDLNRYKIIIRSPAKRLILFDKKVKRMLASYVAGNQNFAKAQTGRARERFRFTNQNLKTGKLIQIDLTPEEWELRKNALPLVLGDPDFSPDEKEWILDNLDYLVFKLGLHLALKDLSYVQNKKPHSRQSVQNWGSNASGGSGGRVHC